MKRGWNVANDLWRREGKWVAVVVRDSEAVVVAVAKDHEVAVVMAAAEDREAAAIEAPNKIVNNKKFQRIL